MEQQRFLVEGYLGGGGTNQTNLWVKFVQHQVWDTIVILEEGNHPYPRCRKCNMFVSQRSLNIWHPYMDLCCWERTGSANNWQNRKWEQGEETVLTAYGIPLATVTSFKYLERILSESNYDWTAAVRNLRQARTKWDRTMWVLWR